MTMSPLAIENVAKTLEDNLGRTALHSASGPQLDSAEALLGYWLDRVEEERDGRRQEIIDRNGNDGDHYPHTYGATA